MSKFLSVLGRPGDFANDESPVLRKWRIAGGAVDADVKEIATWMPAYSKVDGSLPDVELNPLGDHVFVRSVVDILVAGPVTLDIESTTGIRVWNNDTEIKDLSAPIDFAKGKATLTFAIDRTSRGEKGLRVELKSTAGSPAKYQPEGGM